MTWRADILTLFPAMFPGPLGESLAGKALMERKWSLKVTDIRDFGLGRHRSVDDTPFGGGAGMVLRPDVVDAAIAAVADDERPLIFLTPRGAPLTQSRVRSLAAGPGAVLVCGRFEGFDERVIEARQGEEISIGDYVLSGGELPALVLLDAVIRLLPGVMGHAESGVEESFSEALLEYPHYTRPAIWNGREVPEVLTSGNHAAIAAWRLDQARQITQRRRPELYNQYIASGARAP
ncbi:tRNA (guanosine(37)-N1)-methyltransferase TrmD [Acidocella sp. KAb 2-4]|uniref:tRNA (guanosine(37)-N1)-methyltransferase TrmD n=1 Tax=Acidocella sp. KAb 2-4 TaxID=2885158 RepID=UPI001D08135F|nr:tRNA (guanosine(37)-N1)-methyltransferase TrmD [Acidocella sp. KAb 2-4]MCB5943746.1 tRNA (guanosine(37)-N1)-methyltransferase TrmD [Acidocella sp. KAb 2-4]